MVNRFKSYIRQQHLFTSEDRLLLAVSGGVDSVVLCHLCSAAGFDFAMAHCNFQLRGADSDRDQAFVEALAHDLQVPFFATRFDTKRYAEEHKMATQEAARDLRYRWFETIRQEHGFHFIVTAHHANDNVETLAMHFFRGTGIAGLTGIKASNGRIRRPLLFAERAELEGYLQDQQLSFVQDESNFQEDYTRNYFRNTILPAIRKVYPHVTKNLLHNIGRFQEVEMLYTAELDRLKKRLMREEPGGVRIPVLLLKRMPARSTIMLELLKPFGFQPAQLNDMVRLLDSESGRYLRSATHRLLKDRKHLLVAPLKEGMASVTVIEGEGSYRFPNGTIAVRNEPVPVITAENNSITVPASLIHYPLLLRPWRTGDYFYPLGMVKKKKLSRFLIDQKLSLLEKERVWVLEMNQKIIWVVGYRLDDRFKITEPAKPCLHISFRGL